MRLVLPLIAQRSNGGAAEPNTGPHLFTYEDVRAYVDFMNFLCPGKIWKASLYLTSRTKTEDAKRCWDEKLITHAKWYPLEGTTGADASPTVEMLLNKNSSVGQVLQFCVEYGIPVKYHPEVTEWNGVHIAPRRREALFYQELAPRMNDLYVGLRQNYAHLSTKEAAAYALVHRDELSMFFESTCHHQLLSTLELFAGGKLHPDLHCWPNIKDPEDRDALNDWLRTEPQNAGAADDQAGHDRRFKHSNKVPGGLFTYHCALEMNVQLLEKLRLLHWADDFLWGNAKRYHDDLLPDNPEPITLVKEQWQVESLIEQDGVQVHPFGYAEDPEDRYTFQWKLAA